MTTFTSTAKVSSHSLAQVLKWWGLPVSLRWLRNEISLTIHEAHAIAALRNLLAYVHTEELFHDICLFLLILNNSWEVLINLLHADGHREVWRDVTTLSSCGSPMQVNGSLCASTSETSMRLHEFLSWLNQRLIRQAYAGLFRHAFQWFVAISIHWFKRLVSNILSSSESICSKAISAIQVFIRLDGKTFIVLNHVTLTFKWDWIRSQVLDRRWYRVLD